MQSTRADADTPFGRYIRATPECWNCLLLSRGFCGRRTNGIPLLHGAVTRLASGGPRFRSGELGVARGDGAAASQDAGGLKAKASPEEVGRRPDTNGLTVPRGPEGPCGDVDPAELVQTDVASVCFTSGQHQGSSTRVSSPRHSMNAQVTLPGRSVVGDERPSGLVLHDHDHPDRFVGNSATSVKSEAVTGASGTLGQAVRTRADDGRADKSAHRSRPRRSPWRIVRSTSAFLVVGSGVDPVTHAFRTEARGFWRNPVESRGDCWRRNTS